MDYTFHFYVSGRVQGVFFRQRTKQHADRFGVKGWVRNLPDGRVEGMAQGSERALQLLRDWLEHGPPMARVLRLDWNPAQAQQFPGFDVLN